MLDQASAADHGEGHRLIELPPVLLARRYIPHALCTALIASGLAWMMTGSPGPGLSPDTVSYFVAAESVVRDGTFKAPVLEWAPVDSFRPLSHFPPGFPLAIALARTTGVPTLHAARLVIVASMAITTFMLSLLLLVVNGGAGGFVTILAILVTPAIVQAHLFALSEPLFIALLATTLACTVLAPDRPTPVGILAGLASLVRYAGLALVAAAMLWTILRPGTLRHRLRRAVLAVLPTLILLGGWIATRAFRAGGSVRSVALYKDGFAATLWQGAGTLCRWLAPGVDSHRARAAIAGVALGACLFVVNALWGRLSKMAAFGGRQPDSMVARVLRASLLFASTYVAVLVIARGLADPAIPFDDRLLAPFIVVADVFLATVLAQWFRNCNAAQRAIAGGAILLWIIGSATVSARRIRFGLTDGWDYANKAYRGAGPLQWINRSGFGLDLFTNAPATIYFHANRLARELPGAADRSTLLAFGDTLKARRGVVVLFNTPAASYVSGYRIVRVLDMRLIASYPDGSVWVPSSR